MLVGAVGACVRKKRERPAPSVGFVPGGIARVGAFVTLNVYVAEVVSQALALDLFARAAMA